jgi:hypothetical protein
MWESIDEILAADTIPNGINRIVLANNSHGPLYYDFFFRKAPGTALLCHFHGNTPRNSQITLPIITGLGVTQEIDGSLFVPSDPSLQLSNNLGLAWHYGWDGLQLQRVTISLIQKLADVVSAPKIVLWGGSGGGFAALRLGRDLNRSVVLVWNPQTNIKLYSPEHVDLFRQIAFKGMDLPQNGCSEQYFDLTTDDFLQNYKSEILYLQESSDWHLSSHMLPFLNTHAKSNIGITASKTIKISRAYGDLLYVFCDHWGDGHVPPTKDLISSLLRGLTQNDIHTTAALVLGNPLSLTPAYSASNVNADGKNCPDFKINQYRYHNIKSISLGKFDFQGFKVGLTQTKSGFSVPLFSGERVNVGYDGAIDWNQRFTTQASSNLMWLYSLEFLANLFAVGKASNDQAIISASLNGVLSYCEYCKRGGDKFIASIASSDHAVATCVRALLKFVLDLAANEVDDQTRQKIIKQILYWCAWLESEENYRKNNHGLMGSIALILSSSALEVTPHTSSFFQKAEKRVIDLAKSSFDKDGLCNENTIGYHRFNLDQYSSLLNVLKDNSIETDLIGFLTDLIDKGSRALRYCIRHDGAIPPIGDSSVYPTSIIPFNQTKYFSESHFAVIKSDSLYLSLIGGFTSEIHKQVDDTSIYLSVSGNEIFADGGAYLYDRTDPIRRCVESANGHSGVFLKSFDGMLRHEYVKKFSPIECAITNFKESNLCVAAEVTNSLLDGRIILKRKIYVLWPDELIVVDDVLFADTSVEQPLVQRFLLAPEFSAEILDSDRVSIKNGPLNFDIYSFGGVTFEIFSGSTRDVYRGWVSRTFGKAEPCPSLEITSNNLTNPIVTYIKLSSGSTLFDISAASREVISQWYPFDNDHH